MSIWSAKKPWFHSQFDGVGLCLPMSWQGWSVLSLGFSGMLATVFLLHAAYSFAAFLFIWATMWVTISATRERRADMVDVGNAAAALTSPDSTDRV